MIPKQHFQGVLTCCFHRVGSIWSLRTLTDRLKENYSIMVAGSNFKSLFTPGRTSTHKY